MTVCPSVSKSTVLGLAATCLLATPIAKADLDAGQILRELTPQMVEPMQSAPLAVDPPALTEAEPGGPAVVVSAVIFEGHTKFSQDELAAVVEGYVGKSLDLAGLRNMVNRISIHYRERGYLFARAILPAQSIETGTVRVQVVEGSYGEVVTRGHPDLYPDARKFLKRLRPGDVIESTALERHTLILSDQPGIEVVPVIRPGAAVGTGDLDVDIQRADRFSGEVGVDNHGNRFTGEHRLRASVRTGSAFILGDEFALMGLYTMEDLFFGSFRYGLPLGGSGLRGFAGLSYTDYQLGKEFSALGVTGRAEVRELGLSYPFVRSQQANLSVIVASQYKSLRDSQSSTDTNRKSSYSLPVTVQFDVRDSLGAGAVTYGAVTGTLGKLYLDDQLASFDPGETEGSFQTLSYDLVRLQGLTPQLSLMARVSGQYALSNLDSSEGMSLGGVNSVRAYPQGEASGDRGWIGQLELRYRYQDYTPYVFADYGRVQVNADDYDAAPNGRSLSGSGLGSRYDRGPWHANIAVAWRTKGGRSVSSGKNETPLFWVTGNYRF